MRVISGPTALEYECACGRCKSLIACRMYELTEVGGNSMYSMRCPICSNVSTYTLKVINKGKIITA